MEIRSAQPNRAEVIILLRQAALPNEDLPVSLVNFVAAMSNGELIGVAGIETYGNNGLLRSVVVKPEYRNKGIAGQLIAAIEEMALAKGIDQLVLLTETAAAYFESRGFKRINRDEAPETIKTSSEFSHVCPVSAIVLAKPLITTI